MHKHCPACAADKMVVFYTSEKLPVHSVRLLWSQAEAVSFPSGGMNLAHCPVCGFICNLSYDPDLQDYSAEYESTQAFSATFNAFSRRLAQQLIDRYDLHHKKVIEIGCGQGEFISLLCEMGDNQGIGFDPAFDAARSPLNGNERVRIIPDYYSEKYSADKADFFCCKMTLEHIRDVADFVGTVRRAVGSQDTTIFFQVPDIDRILKEVAFWDIYYEHCSYFSPGSIARLFRSQGFDVLNIWRDYGDQYLMIDARPADGPTKAALPQEDDLNQIASEVNHFVKRYPGIIERWRQTVKEAVSQNKKVVLWGSGSKAVAFLTTLNVCDEIEYTVDVNPFKHGTYLAGTGQKVVSPEFMAQYCPDLVILMNPLYRMEVREDLGKRGLTPRIISVGE